VRRKTENFPSFEASLESKRAIQKKEAGCHSKKKKKRDRGVWDLGTSHTTGVE
jgi:hypothetical protein